MKKVITPFLILLLLSAFGLPGFAGNPDPYLVKEFDLKSGGKLQAETVGGSISVTGTNENKAVISLIITSQNGKTDKAEIEKALKNYTLEFTKENNTVIARVSQKNNSLSGKNALSISYQIRVPRQTECKLHTSGGSISLNNIQGKAETETSGGSLAFTNYTGTLNAETSGGSITLTQADGNLDLNTSGGSISLSKVSGDIKAQTSGGSIAANIQKLGNYLTLETTGGSVLATIPAGKGLDLDLEGTRVKTDLSQFKGTSEKDQVKGKVHGGGVPVKMHTTGGTVELKYQL